MRKVLIILSLCLPSVGFTQIQFGIRGGLNFSHIISRPENSNDIKRTGPYLTRMNAGLLMQIPLNDNNSWFILTGPYYSGKGDIFRVIYKPIPVDTSRTYLNYLEIPINLVYKFSEGKNNRFSTGAGVFVSYGFKGKRIYPNHPNLTVPNLHKKGSYYKRIDVGFNVLTAFEVNERVGLRFDYSRSLFDISQRKWKVTNNTFGFSFFWYLKSKQKEVEN